MADTSANSAASTPVMRGWPVLGGGQALQSGGSPRRVQCGRATQLENSRRGRHHRDPQCAHGQDPISDVYHGIPNGSVTGHDFVCPVEEPGSNELVRRSPCSNEETIHHAGPFFVNSSRTRKIKSRINEPRPPT